MVLGNRMRGDRLKLEQEVPRGHEEELLYCACDQALEQAAREVMESPSQEIIQNSLGHNPEFMNFRGPCLSREVGLDLQWSSPTLPFCVKY